jgi:N-acetylglucosamine-6-phosphate deacetylase
MGATGSGTTLFRGARVFTGEAILDGHAVLVEQGRVSAILPDAGEIAADHAVHLDGRLLAPGFVDLQVNGGGGVLFNDEPNVAGIEAIASAHRRFGVTALLPTLITDTPEAMRAAVEAVREAIVAGTAGCAGIHLEGPFLAPSRKGAHSADLIRSMGEPDLELLLSLGIETVLVTLAPEIVPPDMIRALVDGGITVSLGHSDATYDQVTAAVDAGATGITHLFNAMSPLDHRAPGMVGAALDLGSLSCGIIADGHHVDAAALRTALRAKRGPGTLLLVSDAMPTVGAEGDTFELNGRTVRREGGRLTLEDGTLAGSDLDMASAVRFAIEHLELPLEEALRMASLYPARLVGLDGRYGRIAEGHAADFVELDAMLEVGSVWIGGAPA